MNPQSKGSGDQLVSPLPPTIEPPYFAGAMTPPLVRLGGQGPLAFLLPANGFPPATYRPLLDLLGGSLRLECLLPKALWPAIGPPPSDRGSWIDLAEDFLAGCRANQAGSVLGIGHSFGAVALLLAALREPHRFRGLVLLDPTILPPTVLNDAAAARSRGEEPRSQLAEGAMRRRDHFATPQEAYLYFREKEFFADWPDTALAYYAQGILRPLEGESGYRLAWSPSWEAYYYRSLYTNSWKDLPALDGLVPTLVIAGEVSTTFTRDSSVLVRKMLRGATHQVVKGYGHFFPHAAPEATARLIRRWVATLPDVSPQSP